MHKIANYVQQIIIWHTSYAQTYLRFPPERSMTFCLTSTLWFNFIIVYKITNRFERHPKVVEFVVLWKRLLPRQLDDLLPQPRLPLAMKGKIYYLLVPPFFATNRLLTTTSTTTTTSPIVESLHSYLRHSLVLNQLVHGRRIKSLPFHGRQQYHHQRWK